MLAVIDTNVVFEGLTKQGGASRLVVDAWLAGLFQPCVSTALVYEYRSVLSRKLSAERMFRLEIVLAEMLDQARHVEIYFSWRPASPDPGDDLLIDCAIGVNATVVTWNRRDFLYAQARFGLQILSPVEFLRQLADIDPRRIS
jgi:predicted nucleic acid-binding protein